MSPCPAPADSSTDHRTPLNSQEPIDADDYDYDYDYEALPEDVQLWCVYCGHTDDCDEFVTEQQVSRAPSAVGDFAQQMAGKMLDDAFGGMAKSGSGSTVKFTYRSEPFYPSPLPDIDERRLVRERECASCGIRYAVFGEHLFCSNYGQLAPLVAALDALATECLRFDLLTGLEPGTAAKYEEAGVFQRTYVDTVENVVGIVEATAERVFRSRVGDADAKLKGKGKVFQRLDGLADMYQAEFSKDLRSALGDIWPGLVETWAARHVFTHCDGIVDDKYLRAVPSSPLTTGQRLQITADESHRALKDAGRLCRELVA